MKNPPLNEVQCTSCNLIPAPQLKRVFCMCFITHLSVRYLFLFGWSSLNQIFRLIDFPRKKKCCLCCNMWKKPIDFDCVQSFLASTSYFIYIPPPPPKKDLYLYMNPDKVCQKPIDLEYNVSNDASIRHQS